MGGHTDFTGDAENDSVIAVYVSAFELVLKVALPFKVLAFVNLTLIHRIF